MRYDVGCLEEFQNVVHVDEVPRGREIACIIETFVFNVTDRHGEVAARSVDGRASPKLGRSLA